MTNVQEKRDISLFCIVAPEDENDVYYNLFKSHLRTALKDCVIYESCRIEPGKNVLEEQRRLSREAVCCLAITSADFLDTEACMSLLTQDIKEKLIQIKLRACHDEEYPYFKGRSSLPRQKAIHSASQNKEELCKEIAQEVKNFVLARQNGKGTIPLDQGALVSSPSFYQHPPVTTPTLPLSNTPLPPTAHPVQMPVPLVPALPQFVASARRLWHKKRSATIIRLVLGLLLLSAGWLLHSLVDGQFWFSSPQSEKTLTISTLANAGPGSLRQELTDIPQGQSAILIFDANLQGNAQSLILTSSLSINHDVTIEAPDKNFIVDQIQRQQQITITANSPQVAITISAGNSVSFRNIQFRGIYNIQDINNFDYSTIKNSQPGAFLQVNDAKVDLLNCEMSAFYSDTEGSALSNLYGDVRLDSSIIENNFSTGDGTLYNLGINSIGKGILTIVNSTIKDNRAFYSGGAIYNLNGSVNILDKSIIQGNQTLYNDAEIEGGGAIASQGGMILVSDSRILFNKAKRGGGALLLIGANAQITSASILSQNSADFTGSEIDVEPNHDNGQPSYLTLSDSILQSNLVGNLSQDVTGRILSNSLQPQLLVATSNAFRPANSQNTPLFLTIGQFSTFCQAQVGSSGQHFFSAAPSAGANAGIPTIVCVAADQTQESLSSVIGASTEQKAVQAVCQFTYFHSSNSTDILARLFNYYDPLSWQCFQNEQFLGFIAPPNDQTKLDAYCQAEYPGPDSLATLQNTFSPTAYDWKCIHNAIPYRIQMDIVCQSFFDSQSHPNAISVLPDFGPHSWQCWQSD